MKLILILSVLYVGLISACLEGEECIVGSQCSPEVVDDVAEERSLCGENKVCCPSDHNLKTMESLGCGIRFKTGLADSEGTPDGKAKYAEFSMMASIEDNTGKICTGSSIDSKVVITSAGCVNGKNPSSLKVRVGSWKLSAELGMESEEVRHVAQIILPAQYQMSDVAILILQSPTTNNMLIGTSCIGSSSENLTMTDCIAVGWGSHDSAKDHFNVVNANIMPCRMNVLDYAHSKCVGGLNLEAGSALMCAVKGDEYDTYQQIGLLTNTDNGVSVFTDLNKMREWIDTELAKHGISDKMYTYTKLKSRWFGAIFAGIKAGIWLYRQAKKRWGR